MRTMLICGLVSLLISGGSAQSAVIYDNLALPIDSSRFAEPAGRLADNFILAAGASTITGIRWTGLYAFSNTPTTADNFTVQFFQQDFLTDLPRTVPIHSFSVGNVTRTDTGIDLAGFNLYAYSAAVSLSLFPSVPYWVSIGNDTAEDTDDTWQWGAWLTSSLSDGSVARLSTSNAWSRSGYILDFELIGDAVTSIPEPGVVPLLASGLIGLGWCRRRTFELSRASARRLSDGGVRPHCQRLRARRAYGQARTRSHSVGLNG